MPMDHALAFCLRQPCSESHVKLERSVRDRLASFSRKEARLALPADSFLTDGIYENDKAAL
jgi:hypothetical protein